MINSTEVPYWITLAHMPKWGTEKINRLIIKIVHENNMDLESFFQLSAEDWRNKFHLLELEISDLLHEKSKLPNNAFLGEELLSQGFEIIPINSPEYSSILKNNLKIKSPTILYVKGNKKILHEDCIAIVGSRDASEISLLFTDYIAKKAVEGKKTIVSGFAKGVDKQALDSALKYEGQSIVVLPQGIMTFGAGVKKYYKEITSGRVLIVSTFFPKSPWSVSLAMARNPIIYGLANEIYVAQSSDSGGTWEGAIDGLKKGRTILVRVPHANEKSANLTLINKGAQPINFEGNSFVENGEQKLNETNQSDEMQKIKSLLMKQMLTPKQLIEKAQLSISDRQLLKILKNIPNIQTKKASNRIHYFIRQNSAVLFDDKI